LTAYLDSLIAFLSAHPWLGYLTVFLAAALEAVPVLGSIIPGSTVIFALSALAGDGRLDLLGILAAAFTGAVIGDGAAYLAGRSGERRILKVRPLSSYPEIMARFVPPVRAFVPIIAGALGMTPLRFFSVNVPAVALWAVAHVLPGALAGTAIQEANANGGFPHFWISTAITVAIALGVYIWWRRRSVEASANPL
jgi:membrane protein DedA with SNARE-associated domain